MAMDRQGLTRAMAERIRLTRQERFGNDVASLAAALCIPERTWLNYEAGVVMPANVMLGFLEICHADLSWLLHGEERSPVQS
jgi:hypothetical protein